MPSSPHLGGAVWVRLGTFGYVWVRLGTFEYVCSKSAHFFKCRVPPIGRRVLGVVFVWGGVLGIYAFIRKHTKRYTKRYTKGTFGRNHSVFGVRSEERNQWEEPMRLFWFVLVCFGLNGFRLVCFGSSTSSLRLIRFKRLIWLVGKLWEKCSWLSRS